MIAIAPYPKGFKLEQTALSYYYYTSSSNIPAIVQEKHKVAFNHYKDVRQWCNDNLSAPFEITLDDILHDGVRVRLSTSDDLVYFQLKWLT